MDQRVGMPMYLPPLGSLTAKDPGHPERQVLLWQTTNLAMLPFDHHQHDKISRRVGLHHFQLRLPTLKEALQGFQALARCVEATRRFAAERIHKRVVLRMRNKREVGAYITAYKGRGSFCSAPNEFGKFLFGDMSMRHDCNLLICRGIGRFALGDNLLERCDDLLSEVHRVRSDASDLPGAASSQPAVSCREELFSAARE